MAKGKYEYWLTSEGIMRLEAYARDGLTDEQIAHNIGISAKTLYAWKKRFPKLDESLLKGKAVIDIQVENALLKRALGYTYKETTKERIVDTGQKKRHGGISKLNEEEWEFAIDYFNHECCYCGARDAELTKDHIIPLKHGGELKKDNIIPCCRKCNSSKKDMDMKIWFESQNFFSKDRLNKISEYIEVVKGFDNDNQTLNEQLVVTKEVTKEVVPDTTAQIFWLKNRKPEQWNGRTKIEIPTNQVDSSQQQSVWSILQLVSQKVGSGELDTQRANIIISSCNALLNSIRVDEQQKKIEELSDLLDSLLGEEGRGKR